MDREEQMKWHWERNKKLMKINPDRYFYKVESGLTVPFGHTIGTDILTLHFGMF